MVSSDKFQICTEERTKTRIRGYILQCTNSPILQGSHASFRSRLEQSETIVNMDMAVRIDMKTGTIQFIAELLSTIPICFPV